MSFKLGMMISIVELHLFNTSFDSVDLYFKVINISRVPDQNGVSEAWYIVEIHHSGREPSIWVVPKKSTLVFSWISLFTLIKYSMLPWPNHLLRFLRKVLFKEENTAYMILWNIPWILAWMPTLCFKLGVVLDSPTMYSLIPVWVTLTFTQGHRVSGKMKLAQSICCKADEVP